MENLEGSRMTLFTIYFVNWILRCLRILVASMIGLKERGFFLSCIYLNGKEYE